MNPMTSKPFYTETVRQSLQAADYERAIQLQYDQAFSDAQSSDRTVAEAGQRRLDDLSEENARRYAAASRGVAGVANPAAEAYFAAYNQAGRPRAVAGVIAPGIVPGAVEAEEVKEQEQGVVGLMPPTALARRNSLGSQRDANSRRQAWQHFVALNPGREIMFGQARAREAALKAAAAAAGAPAAALPADAGNGDEGDEEVKDADEEKDPFLAVAKANAKNAAERIAQYYDQNPKPEAEAVPTGIYNPVKTVPDAPDLGPAINAANAESIRLAATRQPNPKLANQLSSQLAAYKRKVDNVLRPLYKKVNKEARQSGRRNKEATKIAKQARDEYKLAHFPEYNQKVADLEQQILDAGVANAPLSSTNAPYPVLDLASRTRLGEITAQELHDQRQIRDIARLKEVEARRSASRAGASPGAAKVEGWREKDRYVVSERYTRSLGDTPAVRDIEAEAAVAADTAAEVAASRGADQAMAKKIGQQARLDFIRQSKVDLEHPNPGPREGLYEDQLRRGLESGKTFKAAARAAERTVERELHASDADRTNVVVAEVGRTGADLADLKAQFENIRSGWKAAPRTLERAGILKELEHGPGMIERATKEQQRVAGLSFPTMKDNHEARQGVAAIAKFLNRIALPPLPRSKKKIKKSKKKDGGPPDDKSGPGGDQQQGAPPSASNGPQGSSVAGSDASAPLLPTGNASIAPQDASQTSQLSQAPQASPQRRQSPQASQFQSSQEAPSQQSEQSPSQRLSPEPFQATHTPPPTQQSSRAVSLPPSPALSAIAPQRRKSSSDKQQPPTSVSSFKPPEDGSTPTIDRQPRRASVADFDVSDDGVSDGESESGAADAPDEAPIDNAIEKQLLYIDGAFINATYKSANFSKFSPDEIDTARRAISVWFDHGVRTAFRRGEDDIHKMFVSGLDSAIQLIKGPTNEYYRGAASAGEVNDMMLDMFDALKASAVDRLNFILANPSTIRQEYRDNLDPGQAEHLRTIQRKRKQPSPEASNSLEESYARPFDQEAFSSLEAEFPEFGDDQSQALDSEREPSQEAEPARSSVASLREKFETDNATASMREAQLPPHKNATELTESDLIIPDARASTFTPAEWRRDDAGTWSLIRQLYNSTYVGNDDAKALLDDRNHGRREHKPTVTERRKAEAAVLTKVKNLLPELKDSNGRLVVTLPVIHSVLDNNYAACKSILSGTRYINPHASRLRNFLDFVTVAMKKLARYPPSGIKSSPAKADSASAAADEVKDPAVETQDESGVGEQIPIGARADVPTSRRKKQNEGQLLRGSAEKKGMLPKLARPRLVSMSRFAVKPGQYRTYTGYKNRHPDNQAGRGDQTHADAGDDTPPDESMGPPSAKKPTLPSKDVLAILGTQELPIYDRTENRATDIQNSNMFTMRAYYPNQQNYGTLTPKHKVALGAVSDPDTRFNAKRKVRPPLGWVSVDDGPASKMARRF